MHVALIHLYLSVIIISPSLSQNFPSFGYLMLPPLLPSHYSLTGTDFTLNGVLPMDFLFQPSDQFLSLTVTAIDDNILEGSENFALTLFKSSSAVANINFDPSITEFTIIDNESELM